jgi:hypothetical protein
LKDVICTSATDAVAPTYWRCRSVLRAASGMRESRAQPSSEAPQPGIRAGLLQTESKRLLPSPNKQLQLCLGRRKASQPHPGRDGRLAHLGGGWASPQLWGTSAGV